MAESIRAAAAWTDDGAMLRATARNAAALKTRDLEIIVDRCVLTGVKKKGWATAYVFFVLLYI